MKRDEVTISKHVSGVHKMWLAHIRNPLNQPIRRADTEVRNPLIRSNGNQGTSQSPLCDNVS